VRGKLVVARCVRGNYGSLISCVSTRSDELVSLDTCGDHLGIVCLLVLDSGRELLKNGHHSASSRYTTYLVLSDANLACLYKLITVGLVTLSCYPLFKV